MNLRARPNAIDAAIRATVTLALTLVAHAFFGIATPSAAQSICSGGYNTYPNQLANTQLADATKVMENYNYVLTCPIRINGKVGFGSDPDPNYTVNVGSGSVKTSYFYNMSAYCYAAYPNCVSSYGVYAAGLAYASDSRLKQNIRTLEPAYGLDTIMKLRPVRFVWRDKFRNELEGEQIGFIAQEVVQAAPLVRMRFPAREDGRPDAIEVNTADGRVDTINSPVRMSPDKLIPPLVKAVQQLKTENDALRQELAAIKADLAQLRGR